MSWRAALIAVLISFAIYALADRSTTPQTSPPNQTDEKLPVGLALSSEADELLAQHLERIQDLIIGFKLNNTEQSEAKLRLIFEYHKMIRDRITEWHGQFQNLARKLENGTISPAEFEMEREGLRHKIPGMNGTFGHLSQKLQEVLKEWKGNESNLLPLISSTNEEIVEQMKHLYADLYQKGGLAMRVKATDRAIRVESLATIRRSITIVKRENHGLIGISIEISLLLKSSSFMDQNNRSD